MLEFLIAGSVFFLLFWFSLRPGSALGIAVTPSEISQTLRELDSKQLQTKSNLRLAGRKALAIYLSLISIGVIAGLPYSYPLSHTLLGVPGAFCGLVFGYALLHWSTRPSGWYGVA